MKNFLSKFGLALVAFIATFTIIGCGDSGDGLDSLEKFEPKDELDKVALATAKEKYPDVEFYRAYEKVDVYDEDYAKTGRPKAKQGEDETKSNKPTNIETRDKNNLVSFVKYKYTYRFLSTKDGKYYLTTLGCDDENNKCAVKNQYEVDSSSKNVYIPTK